MEIEGFFSDLAVAVVFLAQINSKIQDVPEFNGKQFTRVSEMRVFRCMFYLLTRIVRPDIFVETSVHSSCDGP